MSAIRSASSTTTTLTRERLTSPVPRRSSSRPGHATTTSAPRRRPARCGPSPAPPYKACAVSERASSSGVISPLTWLASSRVGTSTKAWGCLGVLGVRVAAMGRANARVLPDPVGALPEMSRPARASGMVAAWTGSGVVMPGWRRTLTRVPGRPSSEKLFVGAAGLAGAAGAAVVLRAAGTAAPVGVARAVGTAGRAGMDGNSWLRSLGRSLATWRTDPAGYQWPTRGWSPRARGCAIVHKSAQPAHFGARGRWPGGGAGGPVAVADRLVAKVPVARWRWLTAWWPRYRWPGARLAGQVCRHRGRLLLSAALVMLAACLAGLPWCPASY